MEAQRAVVVLKCRVELVRPMDSAAIDDHHDLCASFAEGRHHLMEIVAQFLGIKMGHDVLENFGGPILDSPHDTQQHAARDPAPGARAHPRLAFEGLLAFDLTLAQRAYGEASPLGCAPPARAGQRKAPQDRFVFIEQNDLATASLGLEGGKFERARGESRRGGVQSTGGTVGAYVLFFNTPRTLSRLSWTPVCWANTVASSWPLHWEERAPCWRGS